MVALRHLNPDGSGATLYSAMWYHAIGEFGTERPRYWWNQTREDLVRDVVLPLLGKEVRILRRRDKKAIFNFGAISYLTVVKTEARLKSQTAGTHPLELEH